jgi:uncharacterized membrane protein
MVALLVAIAVLSLGPVIGVGDDANAILTVIIGLAFTLIHGSLYLGWKRLLVFLGITLVLSFSAEALGVATGLVFGKYHYTENLGPRLLGVPLMIQVAYVAMGYASLVTARVILGAIATPRGWSILGLTFCTALLMVSWDVAMDPYQSTIAGDWIWEEGGSYFGVPLHNYVGWFFTVVAFVGLYLGYERSHPLAAPARPALGKFFYSGPVIYYGLIGLGIVITPLIENFETLASPDNYSGSLVALTHSLSLIAVFVMGTPVAFAVARLASGEPMTPVRLGTETSANNSHAGRTVADRLPENGADDECIELMEACVSR